jgi:1-acyl-sn-glycerol-3-phosphate acyltransferase
LRQGGDAWRSLRAVLGYATFGAGAVALAMFVIPWAGGGKGDAAERRVQRLVHRGLRGYLRAFDFLGAVRVRCDHPERLQEPGLLVVANHPGRLDAVALIAQMPQADCIVKPAYYDHAFLRRPVRAAGYVASSDGPELVAACTERLVRGRSLVVFPEGTRSPDGRLGRFQRGAAHIALRTGCPVVPVTIRCTPPSLQKGQPWWKVPEQKIDISLEVGTPLAVKDIVAGEPTFARAARTLTLAMQAYFEERTGRVAAS